MNANICFVKHQLYYEVFVVSLRSLVILCKYVLIIVLQQISQLITLFTVQNRIELHNICFQKLFISFIDIR